MLKDPDIIKGLVSTIIPVHNRPRFLGEAVACVLGQSYRPVEVIICNDGSTDDTGEVADRLARKYIDMVRVIHQSNCGPGPAREAGRQIAKGEFIQYLDSDDRLLPEKFALQVEALRQHPPAEIAYGVSRLIDIDGRLLKEPFKWTAQKRESLFPELLVDRWWCTHTPLYRRTLCDRIGPWSDLRYSQDWEYDARAGALGARLVAVEATVSEHRHHEDCRQTSGGKWLLPVDQIRFFQSLCDSATAAGVVRDAPEMRHFVRWVFFSARKAALQGDVLSAQKLFALARRNAVSHIRQFERYERWSRRLGWKNTARIARIAEHMSKSKSSGESLWQSWMHPENE